MESQEGRNDIQSGSQDMVEVDAGERERPECPVESGRQTPRQWSLVLPDSGSPTTEDDGGMDEDTDGVPQATESEGSDSSPSPGLEALLEGATPICLCTPWEIGRGHRQQCWIWRQANKGGR